MAYEGQELVGHNGFRLKLVQISEEVLQMEASYSGEGGLPPEHYHPSQDEHFEVLEGAVRAIVDGEERRYVAGDSFDIEAHTAPDGRRWPCPTPLGSSAGSADRRVLRARL